MRTLAGDVIALPIHTHEDSAEGGKLRLTALLDQVLKLASTSQQTVTSDVAFNGNLVIVNATVTTMDVSSITAALLTMADGGAIALTNGTSVAGLDATLITASRTLHWPDASGTLSTGATPRACANKAATYNAAVTDEVLFVDATTGAATINLPAASTAKIGKVYAIKKTDASINAVTVDANGGEFIEGVLTKVLALQYDSVTIVCDGANWMVIA